MTKNKTAKKLTVGIVAIVVLAILLASTTVAFAVVYANVSAENNSFHTGEVKINLNDGEPVISEHEFIFEPGMTVEKAFFVQNESTIDVYYRIYFDEVSGGLADVLEITIKNGDKTLYSGTANELTKEHSVAADDTLGIGERRDLTVCFRYPENSGSGTQNLELEFKLCAEATQTKNNPNKLFD